MKRFVGMLGNVARFVLKARGRSSLSSRGRAGTMLFASVFNLACLAPNQFTTSKRHPVPPILMFKVYHRAIFSGSAKT